MRQVWKARNDGGESGGWHPGNERNETLESYYHVSMFKEIPHLVLQIVITVTYLTQYKSILIICKVTEKALHQMQYMHSADPFPMYAMTYL